MFTRIKPSGWSLNEKLTSAQQNQLDIDHANAIDKTGDTIASGKTIAWGSGSILELQSGSFVNWLSGSILTMTSATGTLTSSVINLNTSSQINVLTGSSINVNASQLNFATSGGAHFLTGTECLMDAGTILTVAGLTLFNGSVIGALGSSWTLSGPIVAANLTISGTGRLKVASRSITRTFGNGFTAYTGTTPYFTVFAGKHFQNSIISGNEVSIELSKLPHNSVLNSVSVYYEPSGGHGALPAVQPRITLYQMNIATGVLTNLGSIIDTAASLGAYEAVRTLTISSLLTTIDRTQYRYLVKFQGEENTNSQTGLLLFGGKTISTITEYDEG